MLEVMRLAAFSKGEEGGNPAGVVICDQLPEASEMQSIAAEVGFSETAFAAPTEGEWRVRYFAPEAEIPFCGHATIALGAALAMRHGNATFPLRLNKDRITVEGSDTKDGLAASLQSPRTRSEAAGPELIEKALALFAFHRDDLDMRLPPAIVEAGARHFVLALRDRATLTSMSYDLDSGREFLVANGFITISLIHAEGPSVFHARNAFAAGGVYEDPATGAAAAALAGYLRDLDWPHGGRIVIHQGEDMGVPCLLHAELGPDAGGSIRVSGSVRRMLAQTSG